MINRHTLYFICLFSLTGLVFSQGVIIIDPLVRPRPIVPPQPRAFQLELRSTNVSVEIDGQSANTRIRQVFHNPTRDQLQGYYMMPVPPNAAIESFSMTVGGKEMQAELLPSDEATRIFEEIVRRQQDPALLEYVGKSLLRIRIFPIHPGEDRTITLSYGELLEQDFGITEYRLPTEWKNISNDKLDAISVHFDIRSTRKIGNVFSPTHEVDVARLNHSQVSASYEAEDIPPEEEFRLFFDTGSEDAVFSVMTYREPGDEGFYLLSVSDGTKSTTKPVAKDITFVLDVSGSMAGKKLGQAKAALQYCVQNLGDDDRFEIIRFSTHASSLFGKLRAAGPSSQTEAIEFIDDLEAVGGTNIEAALTQALQTKGRPARPHLITFITDGKPTIGELGESELIKIVDNMNVDRRRIFTFGIGTEVNTHLLDRICANSGGYRSYIRPEEDIEAVISSFYAKVASPVLTNLKLASDAKIGFSQQYPKNLPDVFRGGAILALGRYRGSGTVNLTLSGLRQDDKVELHSVTKFVQDDQKHDFIPILWATRAVGFLLDQVRLYGESDELREEIVHLATKYGILTPYTSHLVLEDEAIVSGTNFDQSSSGVQRQYEGGDAQEPLVLYYLESNDSGEEAVSSSEDIQSLGSSTKVGARKQAGTGSGNQRKIENLPDSRIVLGRAIYETKTGWRDSYLDEKPAGQTIRIEFASEDYFELLKAHPPIRPMLALAPEVKFWYAEKVYEIYK